MKKTIPLFFLLMLISSFSYGQYNHKVYGQTAFKGNDHEESAIFLGVSTLLMKNSAYSPNLGLEIGLEGYLGKHFLIGADLGFGSGSLNTASGYKTATPLYEYTKFGLILEHPVIKSNFVKVNLCLINEFQFIELEDGDSSYVEDMHLHFKMLAVNYYYCAKIGLGFQKGVFYLRCDYNFLFGKTAWGNKNDFQNFGILAGIRMK